MDSLPPPEDNSLHGIHFELCWLLRISVREIGKFSCRSIEDGGIITPVFSLFLLRQPASFHEGELHWCFVFSCS